MTGKQKDRQLKSALEKVATYPSELLHERFADGIIHAVSLVAILIAGTALMTGAAIWSSAGLIIACSIYCLGLIASFTVSAGYHLLPWHEWRDTLRRLDHVAIYALIAGTFTPLLAHIGTVWSFSILTVIWLLAIPAMIYKMVGSDVEPRWSLASYLGLGWLGMLALPDFGSHLSTNAIAAVIIGGLIYTAGTYFCFKKVQPYRNAIWHGFVLGGTGCLFFAIWTTVISTPSLAGS